MKRPALGALAGLTLVAGVMAMVLFSSVLENAGSNSRVIVSGVAVQVQPTRTRCQRETISAPVGRMRVYGQAEGPTGPLVVTFLRGRRTVARARVARFQAEAPYVLSIRPALSGDAGTLRACFKNQGPRTIMLAGNSTPVLGPGNPNAKFPRDDVRIDYLGARKTTRVAQASKAVNRASLMKSSVIRPWVLWLMLVLALGAAALAIRMVSSDDGS